MKLALYDEFIDLAYKARLRETSGQPQIIAPSSQQIEALLPLYMSKRLGQALKQLDHAQQLALCDDVLAVIGEHVNQPTQLPRPITLLRAIHPEDAPDNHARQLPLTSVNHNDLIVNARDQPSLASMLRRELPSAQHVDLICAFIRWPGIRLLSTAIKTYLEQPDTSLRILTTTYMGVTEQRALDHLKGMGAQIKVCYETQLTRLHAKAWLFHRPRDTSSAFIGSSNLSHSALTDGMEWNVRLSDRLAPDVIARFDQVFAQYWADPLFESYDAQRFAQAVSQYNASSHQPFTPSTHKPVPYPHQLEVLEALSVQRQRHGRDKNLVVSATGTGKTMIAAFDFERFLQTKPDATLLFVAHRKDILTQSRDAFRQVLGRPNFGELMVDGESPQKHQHVFASVQSLAGLKKPYAADYFDFTIIDEFHHAAAPTYTKLLEHLEPQILLGLTATPERTDGQSILSWFGGYTAATIRLWDALERQLLTPFHYFGLDDGTDLSRVKWTGQGYDTTALTNLYTADDARAKLIIRQVHRLVHKPGQMKALGFCVSVAHANFMADYFNRHGLNAIALTGGSSGDLRTRAPEMLVSGAVQVIFTVDLYNEGVDIPQVDTLLMLRPTQSATVFLQQLGRGLRLAPNKSCVTVLDFIGHAHDQFRFDVCYGLLTQTTTKGFKTALTEDNLYLPAGCAFELDKICSDRILKHLKKGIQSSITKTTNAMRREGKMSLYAFMTRQDVTLEDLYQTKSWYWTKLQHSAGWIELDKTQLKAAATLGERLFRLLHINDPQRLGFYRGFLNQPDPPDVTTFAPIQWRMLVMLHNLIWGQKTRDTVQHNDVIEQFWASEAIRMELLVLFEILESQAQVSTIPMTEVVNAWHEDIPLCVHGVYTRDELFSSVGQLAPGQSSTNREGVWYSTELGLHMLFVTLFKDEETFSPQVMYKDYPMDKDHFHWESQNSASPSTRGGKRYIEHEITSDTVLLFVRNTAKDERNNTLPYMCLGPATYVSHEGEKPMGIVWRMHVPIPQQYLNQIHRLVGVA